MMSCVTQNLCLILLLVTHVVCEFNINKRHVDRGGDLKRAEQLGEAGGRDGFGGGGGGFQGGGGGFGGGGLRGDLKRAEQFGEAGGRGGFQEGGYGGGRKRHPDAFKNAFHQRRNALNCCTWWSGSPCCPPGLNRETQ